MALLIPRPVQQACTGGVLDVSRLGPVVATGAELASLAGVAGDMLARYAAPAAEAEEASALPRVELRLDLPPTGAPAAPPAAPPGAPPGAGPVVTRPGGSEDEAYRLQVEQAGIRCVGRTPAGVFRAVSTLAQLLAETSQVPCQVIEDYPRFGWRGLMVDVARSFRTPAELKEVVDLCALYKLNRLHLHLTDNEAWRLAIPGLPELTDAPVSSGGTGYYTESEFGDLQAYAAERHVTVVPEIDLPGHCGALVRAIPSLARVPRPAWLAADAAYAGPIDLANDATRALVGQIVGQVARQTRGPYIHFGADEAYGADDQAFATAVRFLRARVRGAGKEPVAWQEAARAGVDERDILQHWISLAMTGLPATESPALRRHFEPADADVRAAVAGGARLLLSPQSHAYLDRPYDPAIAPPDQRDVARRLGFPHYPPHTVAAAAAWDPDSAGLPAALIAGVEATLFGETITSFADLTTMLLPRLPAIAESAWTGRPAPWTEMRQSLASHAPLWRRRDWAFLASTEIDWH